jgi:ADP-ribose pyrophosphatase YjhB (NUDIX family)
VLLIKNVVGSRQWTLPGGGYHANESGEQCAKREVREELGLFLPLVRQLTKTSETAQGITWRYDCFAAHIDRAQVIRLSIEVAEAQWFPKNQLPDRTRSLVYDLIQQVEATANNKD